MKKVVKIIGVFLIVCFVAVGLTILIGGRDVAPPDLSDLKPEKHTLAEDKNAFKPITDAGNTVVMPKDINMLFDYLDGLPTNKKVVEDFLKDNESSVDLIKKALKYEACQAPQTDRMDYIQKYYNTAILLAVRSAYDLKNGRLPASVDADINLLRLGDMIHPNAHSLAEYDAGIKVLQLGLDQAERIVRSKEAGPQELRPLGDALDSLNPMGPGMVQAMKYMYQKVAHSIETFRSKKQRLSQTFYDTENLPYFFRKTTWYPGYIFKENLTKRTLAILYRDMITNAGTIYAKMKIYNMEHFLGLEGNYFTFFYTPNFVGRAFYAFNTPQFYSFLEVKCQTEGEIRVARLLVALKAYEKKTGALPEKLDALVPEYLSKVPADPFDGKPLRYSREKGIIYSVSKDLKDSGGSLKVPNPEMYGKDYPKTWIAEDAVFKIN